MLVKILGVKGDSVSPKDTLQDQLNEFVKDKQVHDIKFQVLKNYLPMTSMGEFDETMYAMVLYDEK